jgi:hypothetical protein
MTFSALILFGGAEKILLISSNYAAESFFFEILLLSSIFVNFKSSQSGVWSNNKGFVCFLFILIVSIIGSTSATMITAVATHVSSNSAQLFNFDSSSFTRQAITVVFGNLLALFGGAYFLITLYTESSEFGRSSVVVLKAHSTSNATRISKMKSVEIAQLALVSRAFVCSAQLADANLRLKRLASDHVAALKERLCSPSHIYAACSQLTQEKVVLVETALKNNIKKSSHCLDCFSRLRTANFFQDRFFR